MLPKFNLSTGRYDDGLIHVSSHTHIHMHKLQNDNASEVDPSNKLEPCSQKL